MRVGSMGRDTRSQFGVHMCHGKGAWWSVGVCCIDAGWVQREVPLQEK